MSREQQIREQQEALMPKEDLAPYAGQWVALRDGYVVASDPDATTLRDKPDVATTDLLMPVPPPGLLIV
jgi:hypothetical protein